MQPTPNLPSSRNTVTVHAHASKVSLHVPHTQYLSHDNVISRVVTLIYNSKDFVVQNK